MVLSLGREPAKPLAQSELGLPGNIANLLGQLFLTYRVPSVRRTDPGSSRLVTHPGHAVISYTAIACSVKVRDRLMKLSTR
jgi:hypothetical protein